MVREKHGPPSVVVYDVLSIAIELRLGHVVRKSFSVETCFSDHSARMLTVSPAGSLGSNDPTTLSKSHSAPNRSSYKSL